MPLNLKLTDSTIIQVNRLLQGYQGVLRIELLAAIEDVATLKKRVAQLEAAAKPVCEIEGKYGDKFIRVPHEVHAVLVDAVRA
jgi:hypothetical protein